MTFDSFFDPSKAYIERLHYFSMDRTREFLQCARDAAGDKGSNSSSSSRAKARSAFQEAAGEIARGIHRTSQTLTKLSKLVQRQGLFDDPTEEINVLIFRVKEELNELNSKCDSAQQYVDAQKAGRGDVEARQGLDAHHGKVVSQLKSGLAGATKDFKSVLEARSSKMKEQQTRKKELTGGGLLSPPKAQDRNRATQDALSQESVNRRNGSPVDVNSATVGPMKQGTGSGSYALPFGRPPATYSDSSTNNNDSVGNINTDIYSSNYSATQQGQEMQLLLAPPAQYFEARERAVNEVESTILELGTLFRRLTTMIQEQGEMVERIDEDIENAVTTVDSAADVLKKAYDAAASNSTLYTKLGTIFALFIIFFTVFLM